MFWSDTNRDRIYRASLDGSGVTTLISTGLSNTGILLNMYSHVKVSNHSIHRGLGVGLDQSKAVLD